MTTELDIDLEQYGEELPRPAGPDLLVAKTRGPGWVYTHLAADGTVLYVGCTGYPNERLKQHQRRAHWFADIARIRYRGPFRIADAQQVEAEMIREHQPLHNVQNKALPATVQFLRVQEQATARGGES